MLKKTDYGRDHLTASLWCYVVVTFAVRPPGRGVCGPVGRQPRPLSSAPRADRSRLSFSAPEGGGLPRYRAMPRAVGGTRQRLELTRQ